MTSLPIRQTAGIKQMEILAREQIIIEDNVDSRLDVYLAEALDMSRSQVRKLLDAGHILLCGEIVKSGTRLSAGDVIDVALPVPCEYKALAEDIPLDILYEDDDLAVINKQKGLTMHPSNNCYSGTLVNALLFHLKNLSGVGGEVRPGIVHRLDKDTSGVIVVAKNDAAHLSLSKQIGEKTAVRLYKALLFGNVKEERGTIRTNIGRSKADRKKMAVLESGGREAVTSFTVLKRSAGYTYAEFKLHTGRTHQIRVHTAYIGHAVVGDTVYSYKKQPFDTQGQLLHSYFLEFTHPIKGVRMQFTAPLPDIFRDILKRLRISE